MRQKILVVVIVLFIIALLTSCGGLNYLMIASEGDACTYATVVEKRWSDSNLSNFHLLLKTDDGEMGYAVVNAYLYDSTKIGDATCIIRGN